MRKFAKKISAMALCTVFASMQIAAAAIDTGLGNAVINKADGGFVGIDKGANSATLNFKGDSHVNWDTLNVGKGETLNFNATAGTSGITVLNTVNNGMTEVYGTITSNSGVAKLIISNPNGMLYDGAKFSTAGDLMLTTQALGANFVNGNIEIKGINQEAINGVVIKDSDFSVGGEFNITAPAVEIIGGLVGAVKGLKLVTQNGQDFLICPTTSSDFEHSAVRLETVSINGDVYVLSGKDIVKIVNGGTINGNLEVVSDGNVALNYVSGADQKLNVTGDVKVENDGRISYLKNAKVDGNVTMSNSGGFLEVNNIEVGKDVDLTTTVKTNEAVKHFIHVVGKNDIKGNLKVDSIHNIHIGGYKSDLETIANGGLNVGGTIDAIAREGSIAVTVDTTADKIALTSGTLNIISNGQANIKANDYKFKAAHYIGGIASDDTIIDTMENYKPIPVDKGDKYLNIDGGNVSALEANAVRIRSNGDMVVNGVNAGDVKLSSGKDIRIGKDAKADLITVDGETRNLTVETPSRDYTLKYTNIKDTEVITVNPDTEITYDMANGDNGWNKGVQTNKNTYLVVPGEPVVPPVTPDEPTLDPNDNENVKVLKNLNRDEVNKAIDAGQVYTPVAFAADLDEEIDTGVRKNVDGSVTVVRAFTPAN